MGRRGAHRYQRIESTWVRLGRQSPGHAFSRKMSAQIVLPPPTLQLGFSMLT